MKTGKQSSFLNIIYILTPLLCVYLGETVSLIFLFYLKAVKAQNADLLISLIMSLSILSVPLIGLFSDKNCRKKTLVCLVLFELAALILLTHSRFISVVIQGLIGAGIVTVSRAAYLDVKPVISKHFKNAKIKSDSLLAGIAVIETIIVQAAAWTFYSAFSEFFDVILVTKYLLGSALVLLFVFKDVRDKDEEIEKHEIASAEKEYLMGYAWLLLVAFFLYDIAFQIPNYFSETNYNLKTLDMEIGIVGGGIFVGCILCWLVLVVSFRFKFLRTLVSKKEKMMFAVRASLFWGSVALVSVFFFPFFKYRSLFKSHVDFLNLFFFTVIGGVILALIFVYFTNKVKPHERGFLYGILEEIETVAEAIAPVFVYSILPKNALSNIPFIILIGSGLICIRVFRNKKYLSQE